MDKAEIRTRIEAELLAGESPRNLETKYSIPYVTILGWKKKLFAEAPQTKVSDLSQHTRASLEIIRESAVREAPVAAAKINAIIEGVVGLKELEPEFHASLERAVNIAREFLDDKDEDGKTTLSIKEWQLITTTLATAYGTLFNKSGTTVNVAQTNVNAATENLGFFKASQRTL